MSNPYAPPEDRPRQPDGAPVDAPVQDRGPDQQRPPYPTQRPYPAQSTPGPPAEPVPTDPDGEARAGKIARVFALLVLGSVLVSLTRLPYSLAAPVIGLVAIGFGVWALVLAGRAHVRGTLPIMLTAGLVVAFLWSITMSLPLISLQASLDRQACFDSALTISAQEACASDYEKALKEQRDRLSSRS